jgi:glutamate N-acetyltransferase/amino-acid N-acetyltransferase
MNAAWTVIEGGVCAPKGFRASGVTARIKNPKSERKDCALIVSEAPAAVCGAFTTNRLKAAPVLWSREVCAGKRAQAVFANSGNANACTGEKGFEDARATALRVGAGLGLPADRVCILSTGVIGLPLPMDRILPGVDAAIEALSDSGGGDAARAIMTTDTVPKEMAVEVALSQGVARIGAMAKGAGMISPNMATMLCVITTDALIEPEVLDPMLKACVERSFNRIAVDNDMSTNDTVLCLANGLYGETPIRWGSQDYLAFAAALEHVCVQTAQALVRDGEGASKFIEIQVEGAANDADAKMAAQRIAWSQLCKTAFFGQDPNWGRIACAAGYSGAAMDPGQLTIWIGEVLVVQNGLPAAYEESDAAAAMQGRDISIRVSMGEGPGRCVYWTSDLSHEYVTINADYRT